MMTTQMYSLPACKHILNFQKMVRLFPFAPANMLIDEIAKIAKYMAIPESINELISNTSDSNWRVRQYSVMILVKLAKNSKSFQE